LKTLPENPNKIDPRIVLATTNVGPQSKAHEIKEALRDFPITFCSLSEFPSFPPVIEDQPTFLGNALKKARETALYTGLPALADDSGLVVTALGGRPGIHSARYAGEKPTDTENGQKLLFEMKNIPEKDRSASFICILALATPDGRELTVQGECSGMIFREPRGELGFGYDSLFYLPELGKTMAELPLEEKNRVSHRGKALQALRQKMNGHSFSEWIGFDR
jgi:XTP/dITP diphosphohydrolase